MGAYGRIDPHLDGRHGPAGASDAEPAGAKGPVLSAGWESPRSLLDPALVRRFVREARRRRLAQQLGQQGEPLSLQQLLSMHGQATMGVLLILLALITTLPVAGVGTIFSLGIMAWAWRWARQQDAPRLERLRALKLNPAAAYRCLRWLAWLYSFAHRRLRPRWQGLLSPRLRWAWAAWVVLMAVVIFLPIPLGNLFPAVALLLFGLGLLTRDGLMMVCSLLLGAAGLSVLGLAGGWVWSAIAGWWPSAGF